MNGSLNENENETFPLEAQDQDLNQLPNATNESDAEEEPNEDL